MRVRFSLFGALMLLVAGCTSGGNDVVTVTVPPGGAVSSTPSVTAPELSPTESATSVAPTTAQPGSDVRITAKPAFGSKNVPPNEPVTISVFAAKISDLTMIGDDGTAIVGKIAADKATWSTSERLNYGITYDIAGTAVANDGKQTKIGGMLTTVKPTSTLRAAVQIPNGTTVGVGAPIIITFSGSVTDRAAAEKALKVTTSAGKAVEGNWGWLQDEQIQAGGPFQSQVHWRPTKSPSGATPYWPANTTVHLEANLRGVNYGGNQWGREDFTRDFKIGRSQIVKADASTFHLVVTVDDRVTKNYPVSYGKESVPGRATVNGIHIVTEKFTTFKMCNPAFDYCNITEKWAVRINNNGEFIHENLLAKAAFGVANISHGCINMDSPAAQEFYNSSFYGDPVEVTNTGGPQLSEKDSIYDWKYSPDEWKALSAL